MRIREQMREVLDNQMRLWSAKTSGQLITDLKETQNYQVNENSITYQVEVDLLENTEEYVHVGIAIDDGHLLSSIFPLSASFIVRKVPCPADPNRSEHQE